MPPTHASIWKPSVPPTRLRGCTQRVNENCGAAWDPKAPYGPETIKALPNVDNHLKEALFDETADQRADGIPSSGFYHFGKATDT